MCLFFKLNSVVAGVSRGRGPMGHFSCLFLLSDSGMGPIHDVCLGSFFNSSPCRVRQTCGFIQNFTLGLQTVLSPARNICHFQLATSRAQ